MFCVMYELRPKKEMAVFCLGELFLWPHFLSGSTVYLHHGDRVEIRCYGT
jgi:hypothetical protein